MLGANVSKSITPSGQVPGSDSPASIPSTPAPVMITSEVTSPVLSSRGNGGINLKAITLAAVEKRMNENETDDPIQEYVRLKLHLDDLTRPPRTKSKADSPELGQLRERINAIKRDYLFEESRAEELYHMERKRVEAIALREKLQGVTPASVEPVKNTDARKHQMAETMAVSEQKLPGNDIFDRDDEDDLLEMLDIPSSETTSDGVTVTIRDMALPKPLSGRTPKILLQEMVTKRDRHAVVSYAAISGASRARRASVSIRWDGQRTQTWSMTDVGCRQEHEAEQYIATVALHALSFPPPDRFSGSYQNGPTSFRLLPAVFRDLWDELESTRKEDENTANRAAWAKLRSILDPKLSLENKVCWVTVALKYLGMGRHWIEYRNKGRLTRNEWLHAHLTSNSKRLKGS